MPDKKQGNAEVLHQDYPLTFGEREARDEEPAKEAGSSLFCKYKGLPELKASDFNGLKTNCPTQQTD